MGAFLLVSFENQPTRVFLKKTPKFPNGQTCSKLHRDLSIETLLRACIQEPAAVDGIWVSIQRYEVPANANGQ